MGLTDSSAIAAYRDAVFLSRTALGHWRQTSWVGRWIGLLGSWESGSFLIRHGDAVGALMVALIFAGAPFIGTGPIGIGLVAAVGFWFLICVGGGRQDLRKTDGWIHSFRTSKMCWLVGDE